MPKLDTFQIVFGCFFLVPLGTLILGFVLVYFGGAQVGRAWNSMNWPSTQGVVIEAEVEEWTAKSRRMFDDDKRGYVTHFSYRYTAKGETFESGRIEIGESSPRSPGAARRRIEDYAQEMPVTVYYDPEDPQSSCLKNGARSSAYYLLLGGLFAVAVAGFMVRGWLREYRNVMGGGKNVDTETSS